MTNNPPKGRDIMAVYTFYSGEVIQQKYFAKTHFKDVYAPEGSIYPVDIEIVPWDAALPDLESLKFLALDNGVIRQTKDVEKVVWSYC